MSALQLTSAIQTGFISEIGLAVQMLPETEDAFRT